MTVLSKLLVLGAVGHASAVEVDAKTRVELKHPKQKAVTSIPLKPNDRAQAVFSSFLEHKVLSDDGSRALSFMQISSEVSSKTKSKGVVHSKKDFVHPKKGQKIVKGLRKMTR